MEEKRKFHPNPDLKLMDQVKEVLRYHHYAYRTEQTYCVYTHVMNKDLNAIQSPLDTLTG